MVAVNAITIPNLITGIVDERMLLYYTSCHHCEEELQLESLVTVLHNKNEIIFIMHRKCTWEFKRSFIKTRSDLSMLDVCKILGLSKPGYYRLKGLVADNGT